MIIMEIFHNKYVLMSQLSVSFTGCVVLFCEHTKRHTKSCVLRKSLACSMKQLDHHMCLKMLQKVC